MIQEPARVQETTYEAQQSNGTTTGERSYSSNCNCSLKKTVRIMPTKDSPMLMSTKTTTIPILINTLPNPRIILIKVPTHSSNKSNGTEQRAPRTRIIRIPFLPGSVPATDSVKRALPTATKAVNYTTLGTASRIANTTGTIYPLEQFSNSSNAHLNQVDPNGLIVGPPTTISNPNLTSMVTQTVQVSSTPLTLASMAGIQLTGADMQSNQDMSGAMPTATVEEIDVPVFIDEYLQDIEANSSTSSSNNKCEEIRTEICTETDRFDFDFDINLIAEDHIECKEMDQCNLGMDSIYSDNINSDTINSDFTNMVNLLEEDEEEALDMGSMYNTIDIPSNLGEELDLGNILTSSENPMLGTFSQGSLLYSASQTKCFNELPMLGDENSMENSFFSASQLSLGFGFGQLDGGSGEVCHAVTMPDVTSTLCLGVKRTASAASVATAESMPQKRSKLYLDINTSQNSHPDVISTPNIIEQLLNDEEPNLASNISTQDKIYEDLRSTEENTAFTILTDKFSAPNTPNSTFSVSTGRSHESTCQTGFAGFITAPVSPACSTASTSQFSVTTTGTDKSKRKRGRPAKDHADGPDPELMSQMTEDEAKLYRDRIKNNEASRISRRKTKKREEEEMKEEATLQAKNYQLRTKLQRLQRRSQMAIELLGQNYHKNSTYVKREPEH